MTHAAVIGLGSIGRRHARNLRSMGFDIVGYDPMGCDFPGSESLNLIQAKSVDEALTISEIAVICSPHSSHLEHMRACVRHRRPFLVEKPIATAAYGLQELRDDMGDLVAHVGYNLRFHPTVIRLIDLIRTAEVGRILHASFEYGSYLPGWRPHADYRNNYAASKNDGGIILDDIHEIDLACHIFGTPDRVHCALANTRTLGIVHEEIADITFVDQPGCPITHIHMDYLQRIPTRKIKLIGTEGTIECDLNAATISILKPSERKSHSEDSYDPNIMYVNEMRHFIDAVMSGKSDPKLDVQVGIQTLKIATLVKKSAILKRAGVL